MRRRIRVGRSRAVVAGQVLAGLLALVVAWYAAMLVLLALKAPDGLVDQLSGYRTALTWLSALDARPSAPRRASSPAWAEPSSSSCSAVWPSLRCRVLALRATT
jgi:hypothetical protein